jgi:hypothetical protein
MQSEDELPTLVRFEDLRQRGIVSSWAGLRHLQLHAEFPLGKLLGPSSRAWTTKEIADWLASRPTEPSRQTQERAAKSIAARKAGA